MIVAKNTEARDRVRARLEEGLPHRLPLVVARIHPLELGPPVGWPLQYRVSGPDPNQVREIAYRVAQLMAENPAAEKINFDWIEPARRLRMRVDQDQTRLLGLSSDALAQALNTVVSGVSITQVRDSIYLIDVVARAADEERISPAALRTLQIPLASGRTVPLMQLASIDYDQELPLIWRRDRLPTLTVQADVTPPGVQPKTVAQALTAKMVSRAPLSLRESKQLLNRTLEAELERAFQNEIEAIMRCFGTADAHEATVAFREKRPPVFEGK